MEKIINFEEPFFSLKSLFYLYLLMKTFSIIGDRFVVFVVLNIFIFYAPIDKKCPHFLFISRMYIKQIIEGTLGIIECIIPRYEEVKQNKK